MALRLLFEEADSHMKAIPLLFVSIVLCCYFAPAPARADSETILSVSETGGTPGGGGMPFLLPDYPNFVGFSFTLDRPFRDLSITAEDMYLFNVPTATAWLTKSIGPAATTTDVLASTQFSHDNSNLSVAPFFGPITFFDENDVNVSAGTYYFFLSTSALGYGIWGGGGQLGPVNAAPGVSDLNYFWVASQQPCAGPPATSFGCSNYAFPPASYWPPSSTNSLGIPFEIHASPVPEPTSLMLFCTGVLALCGLRLRKSWPTLL